MPVKCKHRRETFVQTKDGKRAVILDADYPIYKWDMINGKQITTWVCPAYQTWKSMLNRCYSKHKRRPGYLDVEVCEEWFIFSNFKMWYDVNYIDNYVLDKDLKNLLARVYSPSTCAYVPEYLNTHFSCSVKSKREGILGSHKRKSDGRISSSISVPSLKGKRKKKHLGYHTSEEDAHFSWLQSKINLSEIMLNRYINSEEGRKDIYEGCQVYVDILKMHLKHKVIFNGVYHEAQLI